MVNIDAQEYLELVEATGRLAFFDIEATGLRGDYNSVLCVSVRPYGKPARTFAVSRAGDDKSVVLAAKDELEKYSVWCGYYSKGFDIPMLNTRLLQAGERAISKRHHLDLYYTLKSNLLTARRSQGHLLDWLNTPEKKMSVSAEEWNRVLADTKAAMPKMIARCESDTKGLEALYKRTKHVISEIKR